MRVLHVGDILTRLLQDGWKSLGSVGSTISSALFCLSHYWLIVHFWVPPVVFCSHFVDYGPLHRIPHQSRPWPFLLALLQFNLLCHFINHPSDILSYPQVCLSGLEFSWALPLSLSRNPHCTIVVFIFSSIWLASPSIQHHTLASLWQPLSLCPRIHAFKTIFQHSLTSCAHNNLHTNIKISRCSHQGSQLISLPTLKFQDARTKARLISLPF